METFLQKLKQHRIHVDVIDDHLKLNIPVGFKEEWIIDEIRSKKTDLISFIKKNKVSGNFKSIKCSEKKEYYILSSAQKRLYFLYELDKKQLVYNMTRYIKLTGVIEKDRIYNSFKKLVERHESLRTSFEIINGMPVQVIKETLDFKIEYLKSTMKNVPLILKDFIIPFDLSKSPLFRVWIVEINNENHILLIGLHHIITDGISNGLLEKDILALYNNEELPTIRLQYKDFTEWQRSEQQKKEIANQRNFWIKQFEVEAPVLELPTDYSRPTEQIFWGEQFSFEIGQAESIAIKSFAQAEHATLYMAMLGICNIWLMKLSGQEDIVVGSPVAGRRHVDLESVIGMFVNTLPLRNYPEGNKSFKDFLTEIKENTLMAFDNQDYPFENLVETLNVERDYRRNALFDVFFDLEKVAGKDKNTTKRLSEENTSSGLTNLTSKFDMSLLIHEKADNISVTIIYKKKLFKSETIERFGQYFKNIVKSIIINPKLKISDIEMIAPEEKYQLLYEFNNTELNYPKGKTLIDLFEEQVKRTPNNCAVFDKERKSSYENLNAKINQLAYFLKQNGLQKGGSVAVFFNRSIDFVISVMAVLKTGAMYLPIDSNYPDTRINYLLENSKADILLTKEEILQNRNVITPLKTILYDICEQDISKCSDSDPVTDFYENSFIIYTSGSTGKPKGVYGTQIGILNRLYWGWENFPYTNNEICGLKTNVGFVDHVAELFSPLLKGVPLRIYSNSEVVDVAKFLVSLKDDNITRITLVPSLLETLINEKKEKKINLDFLRYIFCSGEDLSFQLAKSFYKEFSNTALVNIYGSTEVSADVTCYNVDRFNIEDVLKYFKKSPYFQSYTSSNEDEYKGTNNTNNITAPNIEIDQLANSFIDSKISDYPINIEKYYEKLYKDVIPYTINTTSPTFIGHMTSVLPDYVHDISKLISQLNQNLVKIETSKSLTLIEREAIAILHRIFYSFSDKFYLNNIQKLNSNLGIITSGGSTANLLALQSARNKLLFDSYEGSLPEESIYKLMETKGYSDMVIIGTNLMHYSFRKAVSTLGLGTKNIIYVDNDEKGKMKIDDLQNKIDYCRKQNLLIIAIVGIAGSTETGSIDPLKEIGGVAIQNNIHFHVDAAWGGGLKFSNRYRQMLKGIECANSITFCGHKQLFLPQGISVCLFKNPFQAGYNSTVANYQATVNSFDFGRFTIEGSKSGLSLCLHASLRILGKKGYELLINNSIEIAKLFARNIKELDGFELISNNINIVNYRYIPVCFRDKRKAAQLTTDDNKRISEINNRIQEQQFKKGKTFVSKTIVNSLIHGSITVFRAILSNPLVTQDDLNSVINDQISIIEELFNESNSIENPKNRGVDIPMLSKDEIEENVNRKIPIGKPISNTKILIMDNYQKLVPIGVIGEICVSGDGVTSGYVGNHSSGEVPIINNPYFEGISMYKTGDLGKWLPDGNIEFLGRKDSCVKIRGFRIELGEIENTLRENEIVQSAVVMLYENDINGPMLVAFVVLSDKTLGILSLKKYLRKKLPEYMVPSIIIKVDDIPLTPNGKVDKKSLMTKFSKDFSQQNEEYVEPKTDIEKQLILLWKEILRIDKIGLNDLFFDLGGHSLLLVKLNQKIKEQFNLELPFNIYFNQTLGQIANELTTMINNME